MRIKRIAIAVALCCFGILAFSSAASAQMGMGRSVPNYGGKFNPTVGLGADYAITTSKGENMKMSMAIVGRKPAKSGMNGALLAATSSANEDFESARVRLDPNAYTCSRMICLSLILASLHCSLS